MMIMSKYQRALATKHFLRISFFTPQDLENTKKKREKIRKKKEKEEVIVQFQLFDYNEKEIITF